MGEKHRRKLDAASSLSLGPVPLTEPLNRETSVSQPEAAI
jgi:hypothetical protein